LAAALVLVAAAASAAPHERILLHALHTREATAWKRLQQNVSPAGARRGAVVAAPGGNPEYQFHWTRDGALTMREVLEKGRATPDAAERARHDALIKDWVRFSWRSILSGGHQHGEPKFYLNGKPFVGPWGRPQNDAPAVRAITATEVAFDQLARGESSYVKHNLLDPGHSRKGGTLIRSDLDYIVAHWRERSFDLWEEEKADHFYTRAVQYKALARGAALSHALGDHESADWYHGAAADIKKALDAHWDARYGLIRSSLNREAGAMPHKWTGLDSAVILAAIHTYGEGSPIDVLDPRMMATAEKLERDFVNKYDINVGFRNQAPIRADRERHQVPAPHLDRRNWRSPAMGRYPEDRYTGQPGQDRDNGGNPWVITTNGFAEYYYRVIKELDAGRPLVVTEHNRAFLLSALGEAGESKRLAVGTVLGAGGAERKAVRQALFEKADGFLMAVRDDRSEEFDRGTREQKGATDLTWNFASYLSAMRARREVAPDQPAQAG
jgi:glucoamylase